jgi:hypothetical protein
MLVSPFKSEKQRDVDERSVAVGIVTTDAEDTIEAAHQCMRNPKVPAISTVI